MSKKRKNKNVQGEINTSTKATFEQWLNECGNDLFDYDGILSCAGSDGADIYKNDLDGIPFNTPYAIEKYLIEEGYYESGLVGEKQAALASLYNDLKKL